MSHSEPRVDPASHLVVMIVTDGSEASEPAIGRIPTIIPAARRWEVATVVDDAPDMQSGATGFASPVLSPDEVDEIAAAQRMEGDAAVASAARALGPVPVRHTVVRGTIDDLVAHADQVGADVIVIASDPAMFHGALSTSLAGDLLDHTDIPVLIIPGRRMNGVTTGVITR